LPPDFSESQRALFEKTAAMPTNYPMPPEERIRAVLSDLVGRQVTVERIPCARFEDGAPSTVADYSGHDDGVGVICVADLSLANALGAALTMVSPKIVHDAVANRSIDDATVDNLREVVNVMAVLFNTADTPHVKFRELHRLPSRLPAETARLLGAPRGRRDYDVSIDEYGHGTLSVLAG
jgi:hypothetical protein